jgi:hypothetical protein
LGLYLFAPDSGYSSCGAQLAAILALMAADAATAAAPTPTRATAGAGQQQQPAALLQEQAQLLLLHVDSASRRFAMRACLASSDAATAAASLKPVPDFKFGPALSSLVALRTSHTFDVTLPAVSGSAQLQALLEDAAAAEAARVSAALALLPGCCSASASSPGPAVLQQPLADVLSAARSSSSSASSAASASVSSPVWVDLYCAPPGAASSTHAAPAAAAVTGSSSSSKAGKGGKGGKGGASSGGQLQPSCFGVCRLQGCVQALAYAHRRDPAAKALQQLKADVSRTLAARLSLLADDALAAAEDAAEGARAQDAAAAAAAAAATHPLLATASGARATLVGLPRRVLLPWSPLGLQVRCVPWRFVRALPARPDPAGLQLMPTRPAVCVPRPHACCAGAPAQVCAYLAADEAAADAVERAQQLLPLPDLDASQVQEVEAAPTAAAAAVAATLPGVPLPGAGGGSAGASALSCGSTVAAAAAAGAVAALSVALAFFNLGGGAQQ